MDRQVKNNWAWLPAAMPKVAKMVKEKRALYGDSHVDECWRRGVVLGESGWFFAREGAISVGTPAQLCDELDQAGRDAGFPRAPLLMIGIKGGSDGAN